MGNLDKRRRLMTSVEGGSKPDKNGVYILSSKGRYYAESDWSYSMNITADCIVVIDDNCSFGIGLNDCENRLSIVDNCKYRLSITVYGNESAAKLNYTGQKNTESILNTESRYQYAAGYCYYTKTPSGKRGYLPSLGEWVTAYKYKYTINTAISYAGGAQMGMQIQDWEGNYIWAYRYWSSTYAGEYGGYDRYQNWSHDWNNGSIYDDIYGDPNFDDNLGHGTLNIVRPFYPLD